MSNCYVPLAGNTRPLVDVQDFGHIAVTSQATYGNLLSYGFHRTLPNRSDNSSRPGPNEGNIVATASDVLTGGTLSPNTAYSVGYAAGTSRHTGMSPTVTTLTTANDSNSTHAIRTGVPVMPNCTQYSFFIGTGGAARWMARIPADTVAAGGVYIDGFNSFGTGGSNPSQTVDIRALSTNGVSIPNGSSVFGFNNCGIMPASTITMIDVPLDATRLVWFAKLNATGHDNPFSLPPFTLFSTQFSQGYNFAYLVKYYNHDEYYNVGGTLFGWTTDLSTTANSNFQATIFRTGSLLEDKSWVGMEKIMLLASGPDVGNLWSETDVYYAFYA